MSKAPFMPLWVSDFIGDTLELDASDVGAYMLLLMAQWNRGGASLPNDPKKLQRVARCGRRWNKVWGNIEHYFDCDENGFYNKRLRLEAQNVAAKREANSQNGARGAAAKSLKYNDQGLANAKGSLKRKASIPEPEPEPDIKKGIDTNVSIVISPVPVPANDVSEAVNDYNDAASKANWPQVQKLSPQRSKQIKARIKEAGGIDGWRVALQKAAASDFLTGRTNSPWTGFSFDWLVKPANFTKLMEGNYDNRSNANSPPNNTSANGSKPSFASVIAERRNQRRQSAQAGL
jgi:uncharacterized protein YdaU (DUF1376 family)